MTHINVLNAFRENKILAKISKYTAWVLYKQLKMEVYKIRNL